jgi:acyl carrier protein
MMDENEFQHWLAQELELNAGELPFAATFTGDLGFDSLRMFELMLILEDATHTVMPEELLAHIVTVDDAWNYYVMRSANDDRDTSGIRGAQ